MKRFRNALVALFVTLVSIQSCSRKHEDTDPLPPVSYIPEIEISKVTPTNIHQFETITFHISYTDGDADIGDDSADVHSLEIIDNRDDIHHSFHVPPQSPITGIAISGVLAVDLENVILLDQDNVSETATFSVRLRDRRGTWSDPKTTQPITIVK